MRGNELECVVVDWFAAMDSSLSLRLTRVTGSMACLIELVSSVVLVYSLGYLSNDRGRTRLLLLVLGFKLAMLVLVTSSNVLTLFVG